jgi:transcription elongation factor GreA
MALEELGMGREGVVYLTPKGYKRLAEELDHLLTVRRHQVAQRIRDSKEHGEFAEDNTEFDDAKFEQAMIENRITELKEMLASAQKLTARNIPTDEVGLGSIVLLRNLNSKTEQMEVRIVTPYEADPDEHMVSSESPLGQALTGRKVGDKVTLHVPAGRLRYEVKEIRKK